jgi:YVTN family beta-propeller protein
MKRSVLLVILCGIAAYLLGQPVAARQEIADHTLILTNAAGNAVTFVDPEIGTQEQATVGASPWGIALGHDGSAFISTAEGVAVLDLDQREQRALIPYLSPIGEPQFGEYRPGGMGIVVAPNGHYAYVGVYLSGHESWVEVLDVDRGEMIHRIPVGIRPFDVLISPDGSSVYSLDHDSYTVTVIDTETYATQTINAAPMGYGGFDKPHYGVVRSDGHLLLPFQGQILLDLDPETWTPSTIPMAANTHQHGAVLSGDERRLYIVGTGPAGSASGSPSLSVIDLETGEETIIPLARPHESVALSPDERTAYLTGGYTFANGGWDGITIVDLASGSNTEMEVPDRPLDIAVVAHQKP